MGRSNPIHLGLPRWLTGKESACQCRRRRRQGFNPRVRKILGTGNGNTLSILSWKIPWTEESGKLQSVCAKLLQSCPMLCEPVDCSPPGSSVHGSLQARILEWVAIPFFGGSSQRRDRSQVFCTADRFFTIQATKQVHRDVRASPKGNPTRSSYKESQGQHAPTTYSELPSQLLGPSLITLKWKTKGHQVPEKGFQQRRQNSKWKITAPQKK